jgi:DNA-binding FadR family transcriptional regulator
MLSAPGPESGDSRLMDGVQKRVRQDKVTDIIAAELRRLIVLEGSVGDRLPSERILMEQFGVSRPTLREALRVLESEGLIRIRRGVQGGAVIRQSSIDGLALVFGSYLQLERVTVNDIFVVRSIVEPASARLAAGNPEAGGRLDAVLQAEAALLDTLGDEAMSQVLTAFHDTVLELSGSRTLLALGKLLDAVVQRDTLRKISDISVDGPSSRQDGLRESHATHRRLAAVISSGDCDRAERTMRKHLEVLRHNFTQSAGGDAIIDLFGAHPTLRLP